MGAVMGRIGWRSGLYMPPFRKVQRRKCLLRCPRMCLPVRFRERLRVWLLLIFLRLLLLLQKCLLLRKCLLRLQRRYLLLFRRKCLFLLLVLLLFLGRYLLKCQL